MTGVGESAGAAAKLVEVFKELPLWVFMGLAASAGVLLWVPAIAVSVPAGVRSWIVVGGVVCGLLASDRTGNRNAYRKNTCMEGVRRCPEKVPSDRSSTAESLVKFEATR